MNEPMIKRYKYCACLIHFLNVPMELSSSNARFVFGLYLLYQAGHWAIRGRVW